MKGSVSSLSFPNLLVGNESKDDAAVYDIGDGKAIISTTDFFTPIVDNAFDFGRIAATNAISDIYAMGGTPIMAIAILGWPLAKLDAGVAADVINGARNICDLAGIPLAGGHSINSADPIFGLAVTGIAGTDRIRKNNQARPGCILLLTKPLGIGLASTAEKFGCVREDDRLASLELMTTLNSAGKYLSEIAGVKAMTDVTGFGLAGHAIEMAEGSNVRAVIYENSIPRLAGCGYYIENECIPGGTYRNFNSYGNKMTQVSEKCKALLCDPQTSGGLLIAADPDAMDEIRKISEKERFPIYEIGRIEAKENPESNIFLEIIEKD